MGHPIATISTLLLLIASAYGNPYNRNSEKSLSFGLTGSLFDIANNLITSFGNFLEGTGNYNQTDVEFTQGNEGTDSNPEESGEYFQGDMIIPSFGLKTRNGRKPVKYRWPNAVIPYKISPGFNAQKQKMIREAMDEFHRTTCIKFKPYTSSDKDYIDIKSDEKGCWSHVGRMGKKQDVSLACNYSKGTVIHELMHAVGFYHEQSRSDRDQYVEIQWKNIQSGHEHNFKIYNPSQVDAFGAGYDYDSIMHYSDTAFSKSRNLKTIVVKGKKNVTLGQRKGLSSIDIAKIKKMYSCLNQKRKMN